MSSVMQDAATQRKEKLAALKKRKELHEVGAGTVNGNGNNEGPDPSADSKPVFKFRNYDPDSGTARKHARVDEEDTVEKQVEGMAERVIAEDAIKRAEELDLTNIQPKKPNWDLKRDLDSKLAKLKGKTEVAISQLIRKRLQADKAGEVAASAALVGNFQGVDSDSEEE